MPLLDTHPFLGGRDAGQYLRQALHSALGQVNRHIDGVDHPPQHLLHGGPGAVTFLELLEGHRLPTERAVGLFEGSEDIINSMEEDTAYPTTVGNGWREIFLLLPCRRRLVFLSKGDEIIDEDVHDSQGPA